MRIGSGRQVSTGADAQSGVVDRDRLAVLRAASVLVDDRRIHRHPRGFQVLGGNGEAEFVTPPA